MDCLCAVGAKLTQMEQNTPWLLEYFLFIKDVFNLSDETGLVSVTQEEQLVNTQRHSVWRVESR